ncbi:MAG TPA: 3-deoxy-D-manno-octulosonic acid transferase [Marinagarivorans sp.]
MQRFILALYQIIGTLLLPTLALALLVRSRRQPEYRRRIKERFGLCPRPRHSGGIVVHGASLGEITSLKPFISALIDAYPNKTITVTSFTPAGSKQVERLFGNRVNHAYLPFDSPVCNWLFLRRVQPCAVVFMETEIWPSLLHQSKSLPSKLMLINARLSAKSVRAYQKIKPLIAIALAQFDEIHAQSQANAEAFIQLGADAGRVSMSGNLKFDLFPPANVHQRAREISKTIGERPTWTVGSCHQDEEDLLLAAFSEVKKRCPSALLMLAPRHPERYQPLSEKLTALNIPYTRRSQSESFNDGSDVWLIDTMGELLLFYAIADVCTVAGSFDNTGGHNPLEPAFFAKAITVGPNIKGIQDLANTLLDANALIKHASATPNDIAAEISRLLLSENERDRLGTNALRLLENNRGATEKSISALRELIER